MKHLEDKRCCPKCGHEFHQRQYMMARDPNAEIDWRFVRLAGWVVLFVVLVFLIHYA